MFSLFSLLVKNKYRFVLSGDFIVNFKSNSRERIEFLDILNSSDAILPITVYTLVTYISKSCIGNITVYGICISSDWFFPLSPVE